MLQRSGIKAKINQESLQRRLQNWDSCRFDAILNECREIQANLKKKPNKGYRSDNKNDILKVVEAVENGNLRRKSDILDPNNFGLLPWSDSTTRNLKEKSRKDGETPIFSKIPSNKIQTQDVLKVSEDDVGKAIRSGISKSGGLNNIGYPTIKRFTMNKVLHRGIFCDTVYVELF